MCLQSVKFLDLVLKKSKMVQDFNNISLKYWMLG